MNKALHNLLLTTGILLLLCNTGYSSKSKIELLPSLHKLKTPAISTIRNDIRKTLYVIKSRRPVSDLPKLTFYKYKIKSQDSFWSIISKLSLNIDTLMSVNNLTSPRDIKKGKVIFIPNMRGIILKGKGKSEILSLMKREKIDLKYVLSVNRTNSISKKYIFIPCGKVSKLERSLFLGTGFLYPLSSGRRSSGFGTRRNPFKRSVYQFHSGIDIACRIGSPVKAAREGRVIFRGYKGGYGKLVILQHEHGYQSYYGHLSKIKVKKGQRVKTGECIAHSGNTGRSTGPHLHFEIHKGNRAINPLMVTHKSRR